jgi:hypothetical protein
MTWGQSEKTKVRKNKNSAFKKFTIIKLYLKQSDFLKGNNK